MSFKRDYTKKFYLMLRGVTCLFLHQKTNTPNMADKISTPSKTLDRGFSSMVVIASEKKSFQQILLKHGIEFDQYSKDGNEEAEFNEKMPESQTVRLQNSSVLKHLY